MAVVHENETHIHAREQQPQIPSRASHKENEHGHEHGFELAEVVRVVFVVLAAAAVWFHLWEPFYRVSVIGLVAALVGGYPIFKEALENIVQRRMTMELSMTIALISALAIGEFFTALVITAFVLAAEILEGLTVGRGRRAIQDMLDFLPQSASVLRGMVRLLMCPRIQSFRARSSSFDRAAGFRSMVMLSAVIRMWSRHQLQANRCRVKRLLAAKSTQVR